ncbi:CDP-diacylglycerol--serine O-phosphatidyltransferase [Flavihumibacter sp. CACIAM 22H1]|uniref:CDP-diacylglycerol--serine O-phosphatidyltransferase n=1 Tax=Flavihumibacter sp. CACIAM 22H1 TaxID=1812911 RepID=UPI0007A8CFA9|nr:CDP-diacylglycerol--serine O-phosphatidyltransferase [Flavihumibacter sp. CACIAM 22H1]KYP13223.1 MAG: CDP-alcohol phosphatidyltransferase [Flavihumibacter sp. CACIAM 22H1]
MKQIPNLFTLLNLVLGFLAIIVILQNGITIANGPAGEYLVDMPEKIWMASLFIGLAAVVDFLDGFVARLLKASSEMGKQLDSLADVVSFGVAPGLILYQFLRLSLAKEVNGLDASLVWTIPAVLVPCAAAYRLARFNIDTRQSYGFIGVPVPAVGLVVASFPLLYWSGDYTSIAALLTNKWVLYGIILVLSYLMVSTLPIMAFKFKNFALQPNMARYLVLVVAVIAALLLKWAAMPVVFLVYIIVSLAFKNRTE